MLNPFSAKFAIVNGARCACSSVYYVSDFSQGKPGIPGDPGDPGRKVRRCIVKLLV